MPPSLSTAPAISADQRADTGENKPCRTVLTAAGCEACDCTRRDDRKEESQSQVEPPAIQWKKLQHQGTAKAGVVDVA